MTLDGAIKHYKEEAEKYMEYGIETECYQCGKENEQLAEWLTDYKELKTKYSDVQEKIREIRGYLEFAEEHMNVMGVLEALDIIKDMR